MDWQPGYYYFVETISKDANQPTGTNDVILGNYTSPFNPNAQAGEDETVAEQFQIKATSRTATPSGNFYQTNIRDMPAGDSNGDGIIDYRDEQDYAVPVLEPNNATITDTIDLRAYDTASMGHRGTVPLCPSPVSSKPS
jgi:hypothetical protein